MTPEAARAELVIHPNQTCLVLRLGGREVMHRTANPNHKGASPFLGSKKSLTADLNSVMFLN